MIDIVIATTALRVYAGISRLECFSNRDRYVSILQRFFLFRRFPSTFSCCSDYPRIRSKKRYTQNVIVGTFLIVRWYYNIPPRQAGYCRSLRRGLLHAPSNLPSSIAQPSLRQVTLVSSRRPTTYKINMHGIETFQRMRSFYLPNVFNVHHVNILVWS